MNKHIQRGLVAAGVLAAAGAANADSAAAVTAITAAQTDGLAVAGALVAMAIAVWGAMYLRRFFGGK